MLREMVLGLACAMALAAPVHAQGAWPDNCKLTLAAALPFQISGGHIQVSVQVNGTPRRFSIGTGSFSSSINKRVVDELHLRESGIHGSRVIIRDRSGREAQHFAVLDTLAIAGMTSKNLDALVAEDIAADGDIGSDLLRNFDVEIDFAGRMVNLFRPHPCNGKAVYWTQDFTALPIDITEHGNIRVRVELNGVALYAMLDSGAPASEMAADVAASKLGVRPQGNQVTMRGGQGGTFAVTPTAFDTLKLGDIVVNKPLIALSTGEWSSFHDGTSLDLGVQDLSRFHIYIAYRERMLYLSRETEIAPVTGRNGVSLAPDIQASAKVMGPAEAIAEATRIAPAPLAGTFTLKVQSASISGNAAFLNSEPDFRAPANLSISLPPAEAAKLAPNLQAMVGKTVTVIGSVERVRINVRNGGQPDTFYFQTRITIPSASQVAISPSATAAR